MGRLDRRTGTISGDISHNRRAGPINRVVGFVNFSMQLNDGVSNEHGATGNTGVLDIDNTDAVTGAMWIKASESGLIMLSTKIRTSGTFRGHQLFLNNGSFQVQLANTNSTNAIYTGTVSTAINNGAWRFLVWTYDGGQDATSGWELDVDNSNLSDTIFTNNLNATCVDANSEKAIGARVDGSVTLQSEFQWAQETRWNKVLSGAEKTELYNAGKLLDASKHSAAANLTGYWEPRSTSSVVPDLSGNGNDLTFVNIDVSNFSDSDLP